MTMLKALARALRWLGDHWYLPVALLGVAILWVLRRSERQRGTPFSRINEELWAIAAKREARAIQTQLGAAAARRHVLNRYVLTLKRLDAERAEEARVLERDPANLAQYLERAPRG